jgi:hypothetical protein
LIEAAGVIPGSPPGANSQYQQYGFHRTTLNRPWITDWLIGQEGIVVPLASD